MEKHNSYFDKPIFRIGVEVTIENEYAEFKYFDTSFDIEFSDEYELALTTFISKLKTGLNFISFNDEFPFFKDFANELIKTLDRYGFITESSIIINEDYITGLSLWKEIDSYASSYLSNIDLPLGKLLISENVTKEIIINYAIQYYHFVKAGPKIIAAAMALADRPVVHDILQSFLMSELNHDKLLLKALKGAGIDSNKILSSVPLPETFALITSMQVLAHQEPLSFYSCLFLVEEERPLFNELLKTACERVGLSSAFYKPILDHSHINEDEDHGAITEELLRNYSKISQETRIVVFKHVHNNLENLIALEKAVIEEAVNCVKEVN
ncbi:iron-containing redox enzyme family protein [Pedobacter sp. V48]|uniref:iron-containing redox enzyme family protein n=1 Tax=Pedobacter sp. V48 TaxID=509635 RepID=UPI0003E4D2DA|nr:iron-containing redox enzyme family protein [Pedobacter sp. V48]ETZ22830.1 hypothetical protein N824_21310 [Pedobacter sp. V48]